MKRNGKVMKKSFTIIICTVICAFLLSTVAFARNGGMMEGMREGMREAESTAKDALEDAATDIEGLTTDMLDPENGDPLAEEDGIVDEDKGGRDTETKDETREETRDDTTNERPSDDRDTESNADDTTGVIDGMELEEKGINPWAIVIAVVVVIAVLVLIFVLIPKRRR